MCWLVSRTAPWGINTRAFNTNADEGKEYDFKDEEEEKEEALSDHTRNDEPSPLFPR